MYKEILADAFPIIEKFAPVLATFIGSPISGIATKFGMQLLAKAFNIQPTEINNLPHAILQDPNQHDCLVNIEKQFIDWFANSNKIKMPSNVEINIKLAWDQVQEHN